MNIHGCFEPPFCIKRIFQSEKEISQLFSSLLLYLYTLDYRVSFSIELYKSQRPLRTKYCLVSQTQHATPSYQWTLTLTPTLMISPKSSRADILTIAMVKVTL